jgi:hypothetical protein
MEMIALDTLGKLWQHGHGLFGWCADCGSQSRYWADVKARRAPWLIVGRAWSTGSADKRMYERAKSRSLGSPN